jgi:peptidoglycan/LPS O-acetylase OafA/YrhL
VSTNLVFLVYFVVVAGVSRWLGVTQQRWISQSFVFTFGVGAVMAIVVFTNYRPRLSTVAPTTLLMFFCALAVGYFTPARD